LEVREEVRQLAQPLAEEAGVELVDVEFGAHGSRRVLRVLLDKPGGVSVGDCAAFSRRLSDCLEMNQTVPGRYDLEVSSPGVDRPLRSLEAIQRFAGQRGSIALREPHEGRRNFEGELLTPEDGRAGMRTDEGGTYWFEWADVKSARLVADPWGEARSRGRTQ
jgi:ribosome maturation factor RimP